MHPNPIFRGEAAERHLAFVRDRAFGQLSVNGPQGPLAAHVPVLLNADATEAELHLMRSNPVVRALAAPQPALLSVTGPHGYVSPDWYESADQVPTWNYVAVHLRGTLETMDPDDLRGVLDRLSDAMEERLPKLPWRSTKMTPGVMERMMRALVPCRLQIAGLDGTWKLSQNKAAADRAGAAAGIAGQSAPGQDHATLADWMRAVAVEA